MGKEKEDRFQQFNDLTSSIIGAAMRVHEELGPGLYESVYHDCMLVELQEQQIQVRSEVPLAVVYRGQLVDEQGYKLDLLVEDTVILELKSIEAVLPRHKMQLSTYLRLKNKPLGLLLNFNVEHLREGIHRIINPRWEPGQD
jgi:GxxExxY protein